jgi:hypothetical protein
MANRAKQATLALNLFAIALVGLLYNVDRADDHRMDQQMSQEMTTSRLTRPQVVTTPPQLDAGIKMLDVNLPPPPVPAAQMTSAEPIPAESVMSVAKQKLKTQLKPQSKPALPPMKEDISTLQSSPTLQTSLAKTETMLPSSKIPRKLEMLSMALPDLVSKTPDLQPLAAKKLPPQPATSSEPYAVKLVGLKPLAKTGAGQQELQYAQPIKPISITPLMSKPTAITAPPEIHIQQANLLRGQHTLNKLAGDGGLDMEIFWPPTAQQSEYLYMVMTQCFGMQSAVLNSKGDLFFTNGKDHGSRAGFSPLLRKLMQPASRDEVRVIDEILNQNAIGANYTPVRIFSKIVDARLVDGVAQVTGKVIHPRSVLRANYVIEQGRVYITNITHDGILSSGRVLLANGKC